MSSPRRKFLDAVNNALGDQERFETYCKLNRFYKRKECRDTKERLMGKLVKLEIENIKTSGLLCQCGSQLHLGLECEIDNSTELLCPITIALQLTRVYLNGGPRPHIEINDLLRLSNGM